MLLVAILCSWIINYAWLKHLDDVFNASSRIDLMLENIIYAQNTRAPMVCSPTETHAVV